MLEGLYDEEPVLGYPKQVLVPTEPDDLGLYQEWLTSQRGSAVTIRVPQRGEKRTLQETVTRNATEEFTRHRLRRASDHNSRAKALNELQDFLGLPEAPLRIECYDMSHLQGTDYVGSMVVMEDGLPAKREYRRFKVHVPGNDDFAAMEEVLTRRLTNLLEERDKPVAERGRFAYPPQLLLIDGGKGQLSSVVRVLEDLGLDEEIPVASLAKRFEEVYVPGRSDPVQLPRQSEALYLLQRIRDEAHRFAITYHRQLRDKRMTKSVLDDVPGLGPTRKKRLVKELGGMRAVKEASIDDLRGLSWLPDAVADAVHGKIHSVGARPRVVHHRGCEPTAALRRPARRSPDLWETHATWWQEGFTEGADPEYEEQILPLAARWLAGADRVLDVGCGEGQVARLAVAGGATHRRRRRPHLGPGARSPRPGRRSGVRPGGCGRPAVRATPRSTPSWRASCSSTSSASTTPSRRWPGCCVPVAASPSSSTTRCCRRRSSGWIDDQVLDPPEQYWRIGPYLVEDLSIEEVEKDVFIPFIHRPLSRYVNALAANGLLLRPHGGAGPAARVPGPRRRVRGRGHHPPPAAARHREGDRVGEPVLPTPAALLGTDMRADAHISVPKSDW